MSPDIAEAPIPLIMIWSTLNMLSKSIESMISFDFLICSGNSAVKSNIPDLSISDIVFRSSNMRAQPRFFYPNFMFDVKAG